jgi:Domain of unknown function (DUF4436)
MPKNDPMPTDRGAATGRGRRRWQIATAAGTMVALYIGLIVAYAISGTSVVEQAPVEVPDGGIEVLVTVRDINAATPQLDVDVSVILPDSLVDELGAPTRTITLTLEPTSEDVDLTYGTDRRPPIRQVKVPFDGDIEDWPFDSYSNAITAIATVGQGSEEEVIPTVVNIDGQVQGWQLAAAPDADLRDLAVDLDVRRSLAIILFGLTLVAVLILLPVTTWIVGWKLFREDRLFEAGFLGWIGAMLFATIPIRNFFPGSPPPGSWVDVLVTLWVIVALAVVLLVGLGAFIKNPRRNH